LHENGIPIARRDKVRMVVSAELDEEMLNRMERECKFEDIVTTGMQPLGGD
jgi:uncharacterized protein YabE (DUF348 family)